VSGLHSVNEEQEVWQRLNLWDRLRPNMGLSDADRALLGGLADIKTYGVNPTEITFKIYEHAKRMDRSNPTAVTKAMCALDRCYEILIDAGFDNFRPEREQMQAGFRRLTQIALKSLTRDMLATPDDELAEEISQLILRAITEGKWTAAEFSAESEAWFAEMQARRAS
jgi:hypothetical protein